MPRRAHSFDDDSRGPRLQKVLADLGVASRRSCEELIEAGSVTVNGELVRSLPAWVNPDEDRIEVDGQVVNRNRERMIYVMLHKPRGTVSTNRDPEGRTRAIDLVQHPDNPRLYPVGRLDIDSSGLLLLTNDGDLTNRLTHPSYEVNKGYEVLVNGRLDDEEVKQLEEGIFPSERGSRGRAPSRSTLELLKRERDRTLLYMELRDGRMQQIREMLLHFGHPVKKLRRVSMGPLRLRGLAVGEWRELTARELASVKEAAGPTRSAPAAPAAATPKPKRRTPNPRA